MGTKDKTRRNKTRQKKRTGRKGRGLEDRESMEGITQRCAVGGRLRLTWTTASIGCSVKKLPKKEKKPVTTSITPAMSAQKANAKAGGKKHNDTEAQKKKERSKKENRRKPTSNFAARRERGIKRGYVPSDVVVTRSSLPQQNGTDLSPRHPAPTCACGRF